ncbi:hypothetical protein [Nocardia grenadensis]|uniref:hypothetical protein n=1 Tax=Nocardia grenadensis TaxID=931537 RepID=UPI0007A47A34|nr:hypothetical protein [Nocardia grenadensis]
MVGKYTIHCPDESSASAYANPFDTFDDAVVVANIHSKSSLEFKPVWGDHAWEAEAPDGKYYTIRWHPDW